MTPIVEISHADAMQQLADMFPDMEKETIEMVLEEASYSVELAVSILLNLATGTGDAVTAAAIHQAAAALATSQANSRAGHGTSR